MPTNNTTPGPWVASGDAVRTVVEPGWLIATMGFTLSREANAHLIAAAPELLAALNYLLEQTVDQDLAYGIELTEGETEARAQALAAIAKATGEAI